MLENVTMYNITEVELRSLCNKYEPKLKDLGV